jgi:hypothetical protein
MKLKIKHILSLCAISACGFAPILSLTSCSLPSTPTPDPVDPEYYQFIYDRTFSVGEFTVATGSGAIGTGWLFERVSDYTYYMFTNWHVKYAMDSVATPATYRYSFATSATNDSVITNYQSVDLT